MIFKFDYIIEPQAVDTTLTARIATIETMLLNSAGKAADRLHIGVEDLLKDNYAWVLARIAWEMDYRPKLGTTITVETWIDHVEHSFSFRNFRVTQEGRQIGLGKSIWTVLDLTTRRPVNLLTEERFVKLNTNIDNGMTVPQKVRAAASDNAYHYKTVYSDIDFNGHCNSVQYLQWMLNALPAEQAAQIQSERIDMNYMHEIMPEEQISVVYEQTDNQLIFEVRNAEGKPAARASINIPVQNDRQ